MPRRCCEDGRSPGTEAGFHDRPTQRAFVPGPGVLSGDWCGGGRTLSRRWCCSGEDRAREALSQQIVPGVRQLPGVQGGYWLQPQAGQGLSFVLFDSEQHAKDAAATVRDRVPEFVEVRNVEVREVIEQV